MCNYFNLPIKITPLNRKFLYTPLFRHNTKIQNLLFTGVG